MVFQKFNLFDIFGRQVILNYNNSASIRTKFGGAISLATITLVDFVNKNEVVLTQSQSFSNYPSELKLNTNDVMFAVQIEQTNFLKNPYYNITLEQKIYTLLQNGTRISQSIPIDMEPCTLSHWSMISKDKLNDTFYALNLNDYLCTKKNQIIYIGGQYESPVYQFLKYSIHKCINVTQPQFYSWNPVLHIYYSYFLFIFCLIFNQKKKMYVTADIFFTQFNIQTDNSLFFTKDIEEVNYSVQQYGDFRPQYSLYSKDNTQPYGNFYFNRSRFTNYYYRQYIKLSDVLSQLGGFINAMIALAAIVVGFYNHNTYILELANKLYDFETEDQNEKKQINFKNLLQKRIMNNYQLQNSDIYNSKINQQDIIEQIPNQAKENFIFQEDQCTPSAYQIENEKINDQQQQQHQNQSQQNSALSNLQLNKDLGLPLSQLTVDNQKSINQFKLIKKEFNPYLEGNQSLNIYNLSTIQQKQLNDNSNQQKKDIEQENTDLLIKQHTKIEMEMNKQNSNQNFKKDLSWQNVNQKLPLKNQLDLNDHNQLSDPLQFQNKLVDQLQNETNSENNKVNKNEQHVNNIPQFNKNELIKLFDNNAIVTNRDEQSDQNKTVQNQKQITYFNKQNVSNQTNIEIEDEFLNQNAGIILSDIIEENKNQQHIQVRETQLTKSMLGISRRKTTNNKSDSLVGSQIQQKQSGVFDETQFLDSSPQNYKQISNFSYFSDQLEDKNPYSEDNLVLFNKRSQNMNQLDKLHQNKSEKIKLDSKKQQLIQNDQSKKLNFINQLREMQVSQIKHDESQEKIQETFFKKRLSSIFKTQSYLKSQTLVNAQNEVCNDNNQILRAYSNSTSVRQCLGDDQSQMASYAYKKSNTIQQELQKMNSRRQKISCSFKYIIYKLSCQKLFKTKQNQLVDKAQNLIANNLDIIKILDKIQEIDRIKCILLDQEQRILFNYFPKPLVQIQNDNQIKILDSKTENSHQKYAQNLNTNVGVIKTLVKAKNILKKKVENKNQQFMMQSVGQSLLQNEANNLDRTYGINQYEQIYKAYRKISSKPNKTHTDNILIELMGQELQNIFQKLDEQKSTKKKGLLSSSMSKSIVNSQSYQVTLVQSESFSNNPSLLQLSTNDFMFAVQIQQNNFLKNPYYNITLEQKTYTLLANGTRLTQSIPLDMEPCTISHWQMIDKDRINNTYQSLGLSDYLCAKKNQTVYIGGQYESPVYQFLKFSVTKCINVTNPQFYSWNPVCQSYANAQQFSSQSTVRIQFQMSNYIFNPIEPQNLVSKIISSDLFFQLQPEAVYMTADIFFTEYNIQTDNSLLFTKDIQQQIYSVQQYGDYRPQYTSSSKGTTKPYATFYFDRSRFTYFYYRSYMKLQDMLSQLGGFVNSMIAMAAIIVGFYNRNYYVLELANKLYDYDIQEDEDKIKHNQDKKGKADKTQMQFGDERNQEKIQQATRIESKQMPLQIKQKQDQYVIEDHSHHLTHNPCISNNEQTENSKENGTQCQSEQKQSQKPKQDTLSNYGIIFNLLNQNIHQDTQRSNFTADEKLKQINIEMLSSNRQHLEKNPLLNKDVDQNFLDIHPRKLLTDKEQSDVQIQLPAIIEQENEQQSSIQKLELLSRGRKDFSQQSLNEKIKPKSYEKYQNNFQQLQSKQKCIEEEQIEYITKDEINEDLHQGRGASITNILAKINEREENKQHDAKNLQFQQKIPKQQHILEEKYFTNNLEKNTPKSKQKIEFIKTKVEDIYKDDEIINNIEQGAQGFQAEQSNEEKKACDNNEEYLKQSLDIVLSEINEENINQQLNQVRKSQIIKNMSALCKSITSNNQPQQNSLNKLHTYQKQAQLKNLSLSKEIDEQQEEENSITQNQNYKFSPHPEVLCTSPQNFFTSATKLNQNIDEQSSFKIRNQNENQFTSYEAQNNNQLKEPNFSDLLFSPLTEENQENLSKKQEEISQQFKKQIQNSNFDLKDHLFQQTILQNDNTSIFQSKEAQFTQSNEDFQTKNYEVSSINRSKNASIFKKPAIQQNITQVNRFQSEICNQSNDFNAFSPNIPKSSSMGVENQNKMLNQADYKKSLIQQELLKMNSRRKKISFSFKYIIYKLTCQKYFKTKQNQMVDKAQDLIANNLDIIKILDKIQEIDRIKCLLLDYEQRILFSYFPKPLVQIKNDDQIKILDTHVENVYKQYAQNLHTQVNVIKTLVKAKNKLKQKVDDKNHHEIKTIIDQSALENLVNNYDRTYGITEYESIYKAYRKISTKPNKTHTDKILIELMGQELQKIFSQLDEQKTVKKKKFLLNGASKTTSSNQAIGTPKQQKTDIIQTDKEQKIKQAVEKTNSTKRSFWGRNVTSNN
ncbi:hypothetical protein ABPG74_018490 [Tetrahymena malaccensis]